MVCIPANKSVPHYVFVEEARTDVTTGGGLGKKESSVLSGRGKQILRRKKGKIPKYKDYENKFLNNEILCEF